MNPRRLCILPLLLLVALLAPAVVGQDTASDDIASLRQQFDNLYRSLQLRGGFAPEDRTIMEELRDQAAFFTKQKDPDTIAIAIELQLSLWLDDDDDRVDSLFDKLVDSAPDEERYRTAWVKAFSDDPDRMESIYRRLLKKFPDDVGLRVTRAEAYRQRNEHEQAIKIIEDADIDLTAEPRAALVMSDCLMAMHRFQDAVDVLQGVTEDASSAQPQAAVQLKSFLTQREPYPELWSIELAIRAAEKDANDLPRAEIVTDKGTIKLELFENEAPNTVANFVKLASDGFYDGTKFHRVIGNFMAQGGDPNSKDDVEGVPGQGGPGYTIKDEHTLENHRKHFTGTIAMAHPPAPRDKNTQGSQFYITVTPTAHLNGLHTVFGRVLSGQEVVNKLAQDDVVKTITITRKRDHEYEPETIGGPTPATKPSGLDVDLNQPIGGAGEDN